MSRLFSAAEFRAQQTRVQRMREGRTPLPPVVNEHALQCAFVDWCRLHETRYPELTLAFAVPNGGVRDKRTVKALSREGMRAGVPDWCLPVSRGRYCGLWIEFKSDRGKLRSEQAAYIAGLRRCQHRVEVCRTVEAAIAVVLDYLKGRR